MLGMMAFAPGGPIWQWHEERERRGWLRSAYLNFRDIFCNGWLLTTNGRTGWLRAVTLSWCSRCSGTKAISVIACGRWNATASSSLDGHRVAGRNPWGWRRKGKNEPHSWQEVVIKSQAQYKQWVVLWAVEW